MNLSRRVEQPLSASFLEAGGLVLLELTNTTAQSLQCVEILTVFLKDEETQGAPSRANIKFKSVESIQPGEKVVLSHRTWIDGQPALPDQDQLERLKPVVGALKPYVLDISWQNAEGKSRFHRIPVGH